MTTPVSTIRPAAVRHHGRRRRHPISVTLTVILCLIWAFPIYWMLNTTFKGRDQITTTTPVFFPSPPRLINYIDALTKPGFLTSLRNSLIVALGVVVVSIVLGFLASAALSRFGFPGRRAVLVAILAVQMIPGGALLIPLFLSFKTLGLLNSYWGLGL
ncbi:MAG: carbohydrate ABC transporter permease, partial [Micrococcales bacterium]|nr:carbohydrate ABC transporter permease [Micrococcales bacterium]